MPTYALLGATGSTGSAILRSLLSQSPENLTLNVFVRNKSKLLAAFPDLESTAAFKINIVEGTPSDGEAMQECLIDVDVVLACIASNISSPGMSLIYDTSTAITEALKTRQKLDGPSYKPPTIVQLRSTSLNLVLSASLPWIAHNMAWFCFYYIYKDLERAGELLAQSAATSPKLLDYIFVDPPSIHDADETTPTGYELVLDGPMKEVLSYADLGVAFCEVAERRDEFAERCVGVTATGKVTETWRTLMGYMASGVKGRIWG